jgi:hypothetical protein
LSTIREGLVPSPLHTTKTPKEICVILVCSTSAHLKDKNYVILIINNQSNATTYLISRAKFINLKKLNLFKKGIAPLV